MPLLEPALQRVPGRAAGPGVAEAGAVAHVVGDVATGPRSVVAHVDYVTDEAGTPLDAVEFAADTLSDPVNAALLVGVGLLGVVAVAAYLRVRPTIPDVVVLREALAGYADLVPWMLRLSVGLPLVGAGFQGYLFAPTVGFDPLANPVARVWFVGLGFCLLFGLATRLVALAGLLTYVAAVALVPDVVIAMEYVPGFLALAVVGGGRPSADELLHAVASRQGTYYGRVDPVHRLKAWLDAATDPYRPYVPTVLRVGIGVTFVYLGLIEKLAQPGRALLVVEQYDLTSVVPVDPGMWVLGAGLAEIVVGLALVVGLFTRGAAAVAFLLFTTTLFALPDDPVLAHVTLFGMASAVFTMGAGPYSLDWLVGRPAVAEGEPVVPAD